MTMMPNICSGVGSYFKLSKTKYNSIFHQLATSNPDIKEEYNEMLDLTFAEKARSDDIKNIFMLMDKGLHYGIGILLPNMPFCVQYQILKMFDSKELENVFVSKSMAMGVNFPARTCVIRSPDIENDLNVREVLQMKGRAGRRGLFTDEFALSICWNVKNTYNISMDTLPLIQYPKIDENDRKGILIKNAELDGMTISKIRITVSNSENLKEISEQLVQIDKKIEIAKKKYENDEDSGFEKKITEKNKATKAETMIDNRSLLTSIKVVVETIGADLDLDDNRIKDLIKRINLISSNTITSELKENAYLWTEEINNIKYGLQELHTTLHKRQCLELLDYISILYVLIHRVSMRYLGFAFDTQN